MENEPKLDDVIKPWGGAQEILNGQAALFNFFEEGDNSKFEDWLFRGLYAPWELTTTIERACTDTGLNDSDREKIEAGTIRQLRRLYGGDDLSNVKEDSLYALSLLQHHGAPTRLLDFTYSRYVGIYFALECANNNSPIEFIYDDGKTVSKKCCAIWCINGKWLEQSAIEILPEIGRLIISRYDDINRTNDTFNPLYLENKYTFVGWENPLGLHHRLHVQQGVFLCPGNLSISFLDNLKQHKGWNKQENILKVICLMELKEFQNALERCRRMNISRESLFPGLDGFAQSMKYQLVHYKNLEDDKRRRLGSQIKPCP
jgi:hypothetical protein